MNHAPPIMGYVLEVILFLLTFYCSVNKRLLEASQMAILNFKWAEKHNLIMFWREENQKYLINSTKYLPQVLHKPDTVMDAMNTKMNRVCPRPRKVKFWGNSFI